MRRSALRLALIHGLVAAVIVAGIGAWLLYRGFAAPGPLASPARLVIPKGAGVEAIARQLAVADVVSDPLVFVLGVRLTGQDRRLRAGEYAFPAGISMRGVADLLESGRTVKRRFTVAEGLTTAEVLARLAEAEGLAGAIETPPGEGALLPETYFYSWGDRRAEVLARMRQAMTEALDAAWRARAPGLAIETREQALTLASIIEKETAVPSERRRIAAVFNNRLRRGMRLQSDPTVVYALTDGAGALGRALTREDLKLDSPYNTYRINGLPPGPIANPGRESLAAAVDPADTDALYFVADGNGGHVFARTLAEHRRNVARWRRIRDAAPE